MLGLLDLELWCLGRDILTPEGNLLLAYGAARRSLPAGESGTSCYRWRSLRREVALWGWGIRYGRRGQGAIFCRRYDGQPRWHADWLAPNYWRVEEMPQGEHRLGRGLQDPTLPLMYGWCRWIAAYERWVAQRQPREHRAACLAGWPNRRRLAGRLVAARAAETSLASLWDDLAQQYASKPTLECA